MVQEYEFKQDVGMREREPNLGLRSAEYNGHN
jgi:hypothetical protein